MNAVPEAQANPVHAEQAAQLAQACHALWLATLSLMTAFMQAPQPAHRLLLARRVARNLRTLQERPSPFDEKSLAKFAQLQQRWDRKVQALSPEGEQVESGAMGWLRRLLPR